MGTALYEGAVKMMLLGAGELGKEIVIEAQRLGVETITVDRYANAPASQVAHRAHVVNMLDGSALLALAKREQPDVIVPEVEAIDTDALVELEEQGFDVIPSARATRIAMDRRLLRELAAGVATATTSDFAFAASAEEAKMACAKVGYPCLVKSRMSSGGLGSSLVSGAGEVEAAYERSLREARGRGDEVIVESLVEFDVEVTQLVVAHLDGTGAPTVSLCRPIGHVRSGSHFHASWQPYHIGGEAFYGYGSSLHLEEDPPSGALRWASAWNNRAVDNGLVAKVEEELREVALRVVQALPEPKGRSKRGVFGCELFVKLGNPEVGDPPKVYFNEVSPRPHDTGLVTLVTQDLSEMALHVRAILGLPVPGIKMLSPGAAHVVLANRSAWAPRYAGIGALLSRKGVQLRLFGKPLAFRERRMGLALATAESLVEARRQALEAAHEMERGIRYG